MCDDDDDAQLLLLVGLQKKYIHESFYYKHVFFFSRDYLQTIVRVYDCVVNSGSVYH